jgi:hypothetical protein
VADAQHGVSAVGKLEMHPSVADLPKFAKSFWIESAALLGSPTVPEATQSINLLSVVLLYVFILKTSSSRCD